ncbi:MAG: aminodeoxychorismate/anthranilate synthase component II [Moraxellaceae bacterium]|nr:aminodeoxychorismate/anthranilate synthase component II [Moraxellaceae bacterium]
MARIIFIDNFDSFSYNLVDMFRQLEHEVIVYRNDVPTETIIEIVKEQADTIVALSPGAGKPSDAGNMMAMIKALREMTPTVPMLGICLGHQALIESFGGKVVQAGEIMHGKVSKITHNNQTMFQGLENPLAVARYHSLCGEDLPKELMVTAHYSHNGTDIIMAMQHISKPICGFQFHPESILTLQGSQLLKQTVEWLLDFNKKGN